MSDPVDGFEIDRLETRIAEARNFEAANDSAIACTAKVGAAYPLASKASKVMTASERVLMYNYVLSYKCTYKYSRKCILRKIQHSTLGFEGV